MLQTSGKSVLQGKGEIGFAEFVALMAVMMGLTAISVDIMLPALGEIGDALRVEEPNERQLIITYYLFGFALGQIVFGPLSDRWGRKRPLTLGLAIYALADIAAMLAPTAEVMFIARAAQGFGAAAPRVIALAIIRDRYAGREMAQVMSFVMMVFVVVPILAPLLGQGIAQLILWRGLFGVLLVVAVLLLAWASLRLPETSGREASARVGLLAAGRMVATTRQTIGYAVAFGFLFGVLLSYITSSEQIFVELYRLGDAFPLVFAGIASVMVAAAFVNARLVVRFGMRRVSHYALLAFLGVCAAMALAGWPAKPPLTLFCLFVAASFFCFGLIGPNFNALAMEPMGKIAGTASSFIGFYTTAAGALFAWIIGQSFNGSVRPLVIGFTGLALAGLVAVLVTERGKLAQGNPIASPR